MMWRIGLLEVGRVGEKMRGRVGSCGVESWEREIIGVRKMGEVVKKRMEDGNKNVVMGGMRVRRYVERKGGIMWKVELKKEKGNLGGWDKWGVSMGEVVVVRGKMEELSIGGV